MARKTMQRQIDQFDLWTSLCSVKATDCPYILNGHLTFVETAHQFSGFGQLSKKEDEW